ncbi:hypothetical protein ACET3Z_027151 [Daucus carota]
MSLNALPSAGSVYATYASISSAVMLLRTTYHQIVPRQVHDYVLSAVSRYFHRTVLEENSLFTLIVDSSDGPPCHNYLFSSFEVYMSTKASPTTNCLKIAKLSQKSNELTTKLARAETMTDIYKGVEIEWEFHSSDSQDKTDLRKNRYWFELRFDKVHREFVVNSYIPFVMNEATDMQNARKGLKLYNYSHDVWSPINLEHSSTFETLAMEPGEKKALMDDLDLFVKRRDFFKRVGRAWKRGYLLYGPPGTGKSSLVAAIANYLKFDIYDLQLSNVNNDRQFRRLLLGTANRSILVIEDIDCSASLPDRKTQTQAKNGKSKSPKVLANCKFGLLT